MVMRFEFDRKAQRHPEGPRFIQRAEGSPCHIPLPGDPSFRLKNGFTRDDAHPGAESANCATTYRAQRHEPI